MTEEKKVDSFPDLESLAANLRTKLEGKRKYILIYAYNGIGKTRLSMCFKEARKNGNERDTLYFNAFTEDLFSWDNDLEHDSERKLKLNSASRFFVGLEELEMDNRIRPLLHRYADFDFRINTDDWTVSFDREVTNNGINEKVENIKISRGEENIFIWCFFLAIAQLAIDRQEAYKWVKYIYIDDPISSLDDNNAIVVASHLAQMIRNKDNKVKVVISSHHTLFFNVLWNEFSQERGDLEPYFLSKEKNNSAYTLYNTRSTPFFHHVALLKEIKEAADSGNLYTYHFNMLRSILEKTATFLGFEKFSTCIKVNDDDEDGKIHYRIVEIMNHGNYSHFSPQEMGPENKKYFKEIVDNFLNRYPFNQALFSESKTEPIVEEEEDNNLAIKSTLKQRSRRRVTALNKQDPN